MNCLGDTFYMCLRPGFALSITLERWNGEVCLKFRLEEDMHNYIINTFMMTSSNGNIFRVTVPLYGEFTGPGEFPTQRPVTRSFDVFFDLRLNKRLSKQPWGWWFETQSCPLWRHHNGPLRTWRCTRLVVVILFMWSFPFHKIWFVLCAYDETATNYQLIALTICRCIIRLWSLNLSETLVRGYLCILWIKCVYILWNECIAKVFLNTTLKYIILSFAQLLHTKLPGGHMYITVRDRCRLGSPPISY